MKKTETAKKQPTRDRCVGRSKESGEKIMARSFPGDVACLEAIRSIAVEHPDKEISIPADVLIDAIDQFECVTVCRVMDDILDKFGKLCMPRPPSPYGKCHCKPSI